jgi:hypothetical protein
METRIIDICAYEDGRGERGASQFEFGEFLRSWGDLAAGMGRPTRVHRVVAPADAGFVEDDRGDLRLEHPRGSPARIALDARGVMARAAGGIDGFRFAD